MKRPSKTPSKKRIPISLLRQSFAGAQMSNFLYALAQRTELSANVRAEAEKLQKRWDSVSAFRISNPITAAEMESRLFKAQGAGK
jgi:hypothetical protein